MPITQFRGQFYFLSNFSPAIIVHEMVCYPTVEHAYQAAKSPYLAERLQFAQLATPGAAKRKGQTLDKRPEWEHIKLEVMLQLLRLKFIIVGLRRRLLDTGDQELIEGNTWGDTYWGQCPIGRGDNRLGRLLMQVRTEVR